MKFKILIIILISHFSFVCWSQSNAIDFSGNIIWRNSPMKSGVIINRLGIDTLNGDTILIMKEAYLRLNKKGDTLEVLNFKNYLWEGHCSDDGYNFSGSYTEFYNSGKIKRIGNVICNYKEGEWLSYYEGGRIKSYANFETHNLTLGHSFPYQSGVFKEYFSNGQIRISGLYRVVQKWSDFPTFNIETYELEIKCCKWVTTSVKTGVWREYDKEGNLINQNDYQLDLDSSKIYRDLSDK